MALVKETLIASLVTVFASPTWATVGPAFGIAIDTYIKTATATIPVTGVVIPPAPGSPYGAAGTGTGIPVTTGLAALQSAATTAFLSPTWATVGSTLSPAIETLMVTATLTTAVTGVLQGTGTLVSWVATGGAAMTTALNLAFTTGITWVLVANNIANAVDIYLKTVTFTTTDLGVIPVSSWTGTGTGGALA